MVKGRKELKKQLEKKSIKEEKRKRKNLEGII